MPDDPGPAVEVAHVADHTRVLLDRLVITEAPPEVLARATALVDEAAALLGAHVPAGDRNPFAAYDGSGDYLDLFRLNPVIGRLNPVAPRFSLEVRTDGPGLHGTEVVADMELGTLYEGPVACVHGGIIASLFDQLLSIANIDNGFGAFTGTLTVRYRNACPLHEPLRFTCRTDRVEGRKVFAAGELRAGADHGLLCAEAEGVFIEPSVERLSEILAERDRLYAQGDETP